MKYVIVIIAANVANMMDIISTKSIYIENMYKIMVRTRRITEIISKNCVYTIVDNVVSLFKLIELFLHIK